MERCGVDKESLAGRPGIDTNKLAPGTRLKVDTCNSTYNIEVVEGDRITIQGGNKRGVTRFPEPVGAEIIGSVPYLSRGIPRLSYLGRGHCLVMKMNNGKDLQTSPVLELTVIAPDESWEYCLEWKKQTD